MGFFRKIKVLNHTATMDRLPRRSCAPPRNDVLKILVLLLALLLFTLFCFQDSTYAKPLKFVQVSDVHFTTLSKSNGTRNLSESKDFLQKAVYRINRLKDIDFVVFTGDSINSPRQSQLELFAQEAQKLNRPWFIALGNHEISIRSGFNKAEYFRTIKKYNKYIKYDEKPYYIFNPDNQYVFIIADGVIDKQVTAGGYFDRPQLDWIEKIIRDNPSKKIIIFQHFPLIEPVKSLDHKVANAQEYLNMLHGYKNVFMLFSGHYHVDRVQTKDGIIFVSTSSLVQKPHEFRVVTINDDKGKFTADFNLIQVGEE